MVVVAAEDRLAVIATQDGVVQAARDMLPAVTRHDWISARKKQSVSEPDVRRITDIDRTRSELPEVVVTATATPAPSASYRNRNTGT